MTNIIFPNLPAKKTQQIVWTLLFLMPVMGMSVDLVAPSLPAIATSLGVSSHAAKNIISIYLLGYALGNFFTGFLTDALGRQKLIRGATVGFVFSSLIPLFFPHIGALLLARLLQGLTMGAAAVLARAIFSDVLSAEKLIRLGTIMGTMWGLGPIVGPVIGGYLQVYFGWQAGFLFFAIIVFVESIIIFCVVPETHLNRHPLRFSTIKNNLHEVLTHRLFMAIVLLMGLTYALIIVFNTSGSFLIQSELQYSPIFFGELALWMGVAFLMATFICRYILTKYFIEQLFFVVINISFLVAIAAVISGYFFTKSLILVAVISALMFFICGFIFPVSVGKGLALFRHISGTAMAAMYLINMLITSLIGFLTSFIAIHSTVYLMWIYFFILLSSTIVYWQMIWRRT